MAVKAYDEAKTVNAIIEEVVENIRNQNPQFDVILSRLIGW